MNAELPEGVDGNDIPVILALRRKSDDANKIVGEMKDLRMIMGK